MTEIGEKRDYFLEKSRVLRQNMTKAELKLWYHINRNQLGVKFRRQYVIDTRYVVDFVCLERRLILEVDGGQHADSAKDIIRNRYLQNAGFVVLHLWNNEILENIQGCLEVILTALELK